MEEKCKTIVVAVDESEESLSALLWACNIFFPAHCSHGDGTQHQLCKFILVHIQPDTCFAAGPGIYTHIIVIYTAIHNFQSDV